MEEHIRQYMIIEGLIKAKVDTVVTLHQSYSSQIWAKWTSNKFDVGPRRFGKTL